MQVGRGTYPGNVLRKPTTKNRASYRAKTPHGRQDTKVLSSKAQRNQISDDDLAECNQPSPADTLDRAADKHIGEVFGHRADNSPDEEESQCSKYQRPSTKDAREGRKIRLKDSRGEQERGATPEGLDCRSLEVFGDDLYQLSVVTSSWYTCIETYRQGNRDTRPINGNHQRQHRQGKECQNAALPQDEALHFWSLLIAGWRRGRAGLMVCHFFRHVVSDSRTQ